MSNFLSNFLFPLLCLAITVYTAFGNLLGRIKVAIYIDKKYLHLKNGFLGKFFWPLEKYSGPLYFRTVDSYMIFQTFLGIPALIISTIAFFLQAPLNLLYHPNPQPQK